jgi:hypothetical protein
VLFGAWLTVTIGTALPLLPRVVQARYVSDATSFFHNVAFWAFAFGIPFLATLSFGNEVENNTLTLLLMLPASRTRLWAEKFCITAVAALLTFVVYSYSIRLQGDHIHLALAVLWLASALCSAAFWSLQVGSILYGFFLNLVVQCCLGFFALMVNAVLNGFRFIDPAEMGRNNAICIGLIVLMYSSVMVWLSVRRFVRLQVIAKSASSDRMERLIPRTVGIFLRARQRGLTLNLLRKDIQLLRPLWLVTSVAFLGSISVAVVGWTMSEGPARWTIGLVSLIGPFLCALFAPLLAGSLPVAEERALGTLSWHLMAPVSARRQWSVKLTVAIAACLLCGVFVPFVVVNIDQWILGPSLWAFSEKPADAASNGALAFTLVVGVMSLAVIPIFLCACAVRTPMHAIFASWLLMISAALGFAGGRLVGEYVTDNWYRVHHWASTTTLLYAQNAVVLGLYVTPLILALVHSYRLFRIEQGGTARSAALALSPFGNVIFLWSFAAGAVMSLFAR